MPMHVTNAGTIPASLAASKKLVALNMAFNRLDGNLDAFASAIEPARKTNPQMEAPKRAAGHRKLKAAAFFPGSSNGRRTAAADPVSSSLALGKKLLGTREDWSILQPGQALQQTFTMDTQVGV